MATHVDADGYAEKAEEHTYKPFSSIKLISVPVTVDYLRQYHHHHHRRLDSGLQQPEELPPEAERSTSLSLQ